MALKVKAVEKKLLFEKDGTPIYRYVMSPELYIPLTQAKVIKEAALRSGVSRGVMQACWDAAGEEVKRVTSTDDGTVEDNENDLTPNPSPNGEGSENQNGGGTNNGGGDNNGGGGGGGAASLML